MEMDFVPTLEHLALVKVAIITYYSPEITDIKEKFKKGIGSMDSREWKPLLLEKLKNSVLPHILHEKLLGVLQPISLEIESWTEDMLYCGIHKPLDICWKSFGTIDRLETAKRFVQSEDSNVIQRFAMACHFWMSDDVLKIWKEATVYERIHIEMTLMQEKKESISNETGERKPKRFKTNRVGDFLMKWFDWLHKGGDPNERHLFLDESLFWYDHVPPESSLIQELPINKLHSLMQQKYYNTNYGRMYFLCMNDVQKMFYFQKEPLIVLKHFLDWPLQFKFLEIAEQCWIHMTECEFFRILLHITEQKISRFCSDFNYVRLLQEFWNQSPEHFKEYAKERRHFFWIKDYIVV
ncbi:uncharacterized protein NPIL_378561 [Nephila pilipes]|uniref:Uncharacterized protein n=1 Tax=Nephila pilipes TaxID=299642 RepID=A0A8X6NJ28_NEPPI|nr:uncharacterized protein NPIL_378561 [Nephila pilipes]